MKVMIVFLGLFIINISFLSFQGDMGRYVRCQTFLKAVAEECAAGAALYYDEEAYAGGEFCFSYEESRTYIEYILERSIEAVPLPEKGSVNYAVRFRDDNLGYDADEEPSNPELGEEDGNTPSVTVTLTAETEDLFHLPFLQVREIVRAAKYELPQ